MDKNIAFDKNWWHERLAPGVPNAVAWKSVGEAALKFLNEWVPEGDMISTATLVEALYPEVLAKHSDAAMAVRKRIIEALISKTGCVKHELYNCVTLGPVVERLIFGRRQKTRPRLWHRPKL